MLLNNPAAPVPQPQQGIDLMATIPARTLTPELAGYRAQFEQAKTDFNALVEGLNDEQFNWRPGEDQWSAAECIDHLVAIGTLMMRKLDEGIEKAEANGWRSDGPFRYGRIGNWFVNAVGPRNEKNRRKFKAPAVYAPTSNHSVSRLEKAFCDMQDEFITRVERANGLDLAKVKLSSPVTSLLKFSLGQWFALLAGHQQRHFQQAMEVKARIHRNASGESETENLSLPQ